MRKLFTLMTIMALVLPSCQKINERLDILDNRIDHIEYTQIASLEEQIDAINTSIPQLKQMDTELEKYITTLNETATNLEQKIIDINTNITKLEDDLDKAIENAEAANNTLREELIIQLLSTTALLNDELVKIDSTIATLTTTDKDLEKKIADLETYVSNNLKNTEDWVETTFATLEQHRTLAEDIVTIKKQIENINSINPELESSIEAKISEDITAALSAYDETLNQKIDEITEAYDAIIKTTYEEITAAYTEAIASAIASIETSLKDWVNEQLTSYYTIAEIDAEITILRQTISDGDSTLLDELDALESQVETALTEVTEAYKKAIDEAINTNNGIIDTKIATEIATVNQLITDEVATINDRLDDIENRLDILEGRVDDLYNRTLSIEFEHSDEIAIIAGESCIVKYTVTSSEPEIHIAAIASNGWKATITRITERTGYITVNAPNPLTTDPIIVFVSDANTTIMRNLTFVDGVTTIATEAYAITNEETTLNVGVSTNLDYTVNIPASASSWISLDGITTRATLRDDTIKLSIKENKSTASRTATIQLVCDDTEVGTIAIYQQGIKVAYNELIYTSSDGKVVTPYQTNGFNANIVSNTYSNGRGLIIFDKDIETIGEYAFYNCTKLTDIKIPDSVTEIREYAFYSCSLSEINLSNYVKTIGDSAFQNCDNLTSVIIPDSVTSLGNSFLSSCSKLTSVTIPDSITSLGNSFLSSCSKLTSITLPNSITTIGNSFLHGCSSLISITLPASITSFGTYAFFNCTGLKIMYCKPATPPTVGASYAFGNCDSGLVIYVPEESVDAYKSTNVWKSRTIKGYTFNN